MNEKTNIIPEWKDPFLYKGKKITIKGKLFKISIKGGNQEETLKAIEEMKEILENQVKPLAK